MSSTAHSAIADAILASLKAAGVAGAGLPRVQPVALSIGMIGDQWPAIFRSILRAGDRPDHGQAECGNGGGAVTVTLMLHDSLCLLLFWSCFCRLVRTDHDTIPAIRFGFVLLATASIACLIGPGFGWLRVQWPGVLLLAAVTVVQVATAHYWRHDVPKPFLRRPGADLIPKPVTGKGAADMASRNIDDLNHAMQPLARQFLAKCQAAGIEVMIYCTFRDDAEQAALYAKGRGGVAGPIVTNARPGESWHNWRLAFDFVPMVAGKPQWGDTTLYRRCGEVGEALGMEWAGRWTGKLRETAHMQFTGGKTLDVVRAAVRRLA